jgi:hypothetical protein
MWTAEAREYRLARNERDPILLDWAAILKAQSSGR